MEPRIKHAELARAWLDGKEIEKQVSPYRWVPYEQDEVVGMPRFHQNNKYRIKPEPLVLKYRRYVFADGDRAGYRILIATTDSDVQALSSYKQVEWIDTEWKTFDYFPKEVK